MMITKNPLSIWRVFTAHSYWAQLHISGSFRHKRYSGMLFAPSMGVIIIPSPQMAAAVLINIFIVHTCNDTCRALNILAVIMSPDQVWLRKITKVVLKFPEVEDKPSQSRAKSFKHLETEQGCQVSEERVIKDIPCTRVRTHTHTRTYVVQHILLSLTPWIPILGICLELSLNCLNCPKWTLHSSTPASSLPHEQTSVIPTFGSSDLKVRHKVLQDAVSGKKRRRFILWF